MKQSFMRAVIGIPTVAALLTLTTSCSTISTQSVNERTDPMQPSIDGIEGDLLDIGEKCLVSKEMISWYSAFADANDQLARAIIADETLSDFTKQKALLEVGIIGEKLFEQLGLELLVLAYMDDMLKEVSELHPVAAAIREACNPYFESGPVI